MSFDWRFFKSSGASRIFELQLFTSSVTRDKTTPNHPFLSPECQPDLSKSWIGRSDHRISAQMVWKRLLVGDFNCTKTISDSSRSRPEFAFQGEYWTWWGRKGHRMNSTAPLDFLIKLFVFGMSNLAFSALHELQAGMRTMYCGILVHNGIRLERVPSISLQNSCLTSFPMDYLPDKEQNNLWPQFSRNTSESDWNNSTRTRCEWRRIGTYPHLNMVSPDPILVGTIPKWARKIFWKHRNAFNLEFGSQRKKVEWAKRDFQWPRVLSDTERPIDSRRKSEKK